MPKEICQMKNLKILVIRDNEILELPTNIDNLKNLKELHIQGNRIQLLPVSISKLEILGSKAIFKGDSNPWVTSLMEAMKLGLNHLQDYLTSEEYEKYYMKKSVTL